MRDNCGPNSRNRTLLERRPGNGCVHGHPEIHECHNALTDFAEQIPCSKVTPPIFKIYNEFVEVGPVGRSAPTPEILPPTLQKLIFALTTAFRTQAYILKTI